MRKNGARMIVPTSCNLLDMKLAERVKYVVENRPISASAWSIQAGKSRGYAQKLTERDATRPDTAALRRMADVAGVPRAWFVDGEGDPPVFGTPAPSPRTELRVERDPAPHLDTSGLGTSLERAVGHAFDPKRHDWADGQDVIQALREINRHDRPEADMIEAARRWLDAAHDLRREGTPVTSVTLLDRITFGKGPQRPAGSDSASEAMQREVVEYAARDGVTFGEGAAAIEEFRQRGKKGGQE